MISRIPRHIIENYPERITFVSGNYSLCDGAYLIPHTTNGLEKIGKREMMYRRTTDGWRPDDFSHEQSLVLDTDKGLIIINSCSHGGAVNIINEVKKVFPDKHIYGLVGGFHLFNKSNSQVMMILDIPRGDMPEIREMSEYYLYDSAERIHGYYIVFENEEDCEEYRDLFFDWFGDEIGEEMGFESFTLRTEERMNGLYRDGDTLIWITGYLYDTPTALPLIYKKLGLSYPEISTDF